VRVFICKGELRIGIENERKTNLKIWREGMMGKWREFVKNELDENEFELKRKTEV
jgi:hypothetical protein